MKKNLFAFLILFSVLAFAVPSIAGGPWYVRSGAGGTADGLSWTNAKLTLAAAFTAASAGDYVYVSEDHAETQSSALTLTPPSTFAAPVYIWCVDHTTNALATTATITTTGPNNLVFGGAGSTYYYGITFSVGTGSAPVGMVTTFTSYANLKFDTCKLVNATTATTGGYNFSANLGDTLTLLNTTLKFGQAGQSVQSNTGLHFNWLNTPSAVDSGGSKPTYLTNLSNGTIELLYDGIDLSYLGSNAIFNAAGGNGANKIYLQNSRLGTAYTLMTGAIPSPSTEIYMDNCDSGSLNYAMDHEKYQGSIKSTHATYRTGGATDGTTAISWAMTTLTHSNFFWPLESPPIVLWNSTTGSAKSALIYITSSTASLTDADVFVRLEYLGTTGHTQSVRAVKEGSVIGARSLVTGAPPIIPAGTALAADGGGTWNSSAGHDYVLTVTLDGTTNPYAALAGPIKATVMVAKPSITVYVDPKVTWQ